jgi:hypothetical protein
MKCAQTRSVTLPPPPAEARPEPLSSIPARCSKAFLSLWFPLLNPPLPPETLESAVFSLSKPLFATICAKPNPGFATPKVEARNKLETALNQVSSYILVPSGPVFIRVLRVSLVIGAELRFPTVFAQAIDSPGIPAVVILQLPTTQRVQLLDDISMPWHSVASLVPLSLPVPLVRSRGQRHLVRWLALRRSPPLVNAIPLSSIDPVPLVLLCWSCQPGDTSRCHPTASNSPLSGRIITSYRLRVRAQTFQNASSITNYRLMPTTVGTTSNG